MEILHDESGRRTILVALAQNDDADSFRAHLSRDFKTLPASSVNECLELLRERTASLSAIVIDIDMAMANDYAFLNTVTSNRLFDTIPVLIATLREPTEADERCLEKGAVDFLMKPYTPALMKRRIMNAIRIKRSSTFYEIESILKQLPSNIFLKDAECRYVFATHYWHHLKMGDDPNWTIRGKTDLEIRKDRENAIKAMEADREILRTGKGTSYVIESNADGVQEFMELIKQPVFDEDGKVIGIIALINDVTETELLKRELEKYANTDELTGLGNRRAFDSAIATLSDPDKMPIAIIEADCDLLKVVNDTFGHPVGDEYIRMAATAFKTALPDKALAFRTGGDEFVAFLPNTTEEQAAEIMNSMQRYAELFKLHERPVSISCGAAAVSQPDDDPQQAISRADSAMYENKAARKLARS